MPEVSVPVVFKAALRDVFGPVAREHGFRGSAPTWRRSNRAGDWLVVNVQSRSSNSAEQGSYIINLAVCPEPWLACWQETRFPFAVPKGLTAAHGMLSWRVGVRLWPAASTPDTSHRHSEEWWRVDAADRAPAVVTDMLNRLNQEDGWPLLTALLDRGELLRTVRLPWSTSPAAVHSDLMDSYEAIVRADEGMSDRLAGLVHAIRTEDEPHKQEYRDRVADWIVARSARRDAVLVTDKPGSIR